MNYGKTIMRNTQGLFKKVIHPVCEKKKDSNLLISIKYFKISFFCHKYFSYEQILMHIYI